MPPKVLYHLQLNSIPWLRIALRLGYPRLEAVAAPQKIMLESLIEKTLESWHPQAIYQTVPVKQITSEFIKIDTLVIPGSEVACKFQGSLYLTLLAVTAGEKIMQQRDLLFQNQEFTQATMLDAILSELTDELANQLQKMLSREALLKGMHLTMRYSPGYGDLPLSFQKNLLDFLGAKQIGLTHNESFLLIPEKSVTAVIGWIRK